MTRRPRRRAPLLLICAAAGSVLASCAVLQPPFLAPTPGREGKPPVSVEVKIDGNHGISEARIRREIEDYMLDLSRDPTRESAVYDAALDVEDLYRTEGYPIAKVTYDYHPPPEDAPWPARVQPRIRITEGPQIMVEMELKGFHSHEEEELLALWSRRHLGLFGLDEPVFDQAQVRSFAESLRTFYRAHGYLDAVVSEPAIEIDFDTRIAHVRIGIEEGSVHKIRNVTVPKNVLEALGRDAPRAPVGKDFTQSILQTYGFEIRTALRRKGHPNPRIVLETEQEPLGLAVDVHVEGEAGPIAHVTGVELSGNQKTVGWLILDKLPVRAGDRYDGKKVDEALHKLYLTGLFRLVEIREKPVDGDATRLLLQIHVEELDSRSLELLGGYGSYEGLRGGVRLEERNLFGTGRSIALENKVSQRGFSTSATLTDPDVLSTATALTIRGEYFQREEPAFTDEAIGGTVALSRTLAKGLTGRLGYTYRDRTDPSTDTQLPENQLVDYIEGRVFLELRNDRRDNLLFPKSGHMEFLSLERISPALGASVSLDRLTFRVTTHLRLSRKLNLVLRSEQNVLWPHEGSANVPLQERFFNGGEDTVRSFREAQLGPKDATGKPIGGEYRNLLGAELRAPLVGTFEGALFVDAGNVGRSIQDFSLDDMRYGIGAGVRWLLPIGPVRLDGAWNPDRRVTEREWTIHFSVGYAF